MHRPGRDRTELTFVGWTVEERWSVVRGAWNLAVVGMVVVVEIMTDRGKTPELRAQSLKSSQIWFTFS